MVVVLPLKAYDRTATLFQGIFCTKFFQNSFEIQPFIHIIAAAFNRTIMELKFLIPSQRRTGQDRF